MKKKKNISFLVVPIICLGLFSFSQIAKADTLPTKGWIDSPSNGSEVKGQLTVKGWLLDQVGVKEMNVLVDGNLIGAVTYGLPRDDVNQAFPQYENANSGYQYQFDTNSLQDGTHKLTVKETSKSNQVYTINESIITNNHPDQVNQNLPIKGWIDSLSTSGTTQLKQGDTVKGWILDPKGISKIEVYIDGKLEGQAKSGLSRTDVSNAYPDYKDENSGYSYLFNDKSLATGKHQLVVKETSKGGSTYSVQRSFVYQEIPPKGNIDSPGTGTEVAGNDTVKGWLEDLCGVANVEVYINGKATGTAKYGLPRSDVDKVFPQYGNPNSGFSYTLPNLATGSYTLQIKETGNNGDSYTLQRQITVKDKLPDKGNIDSPTTSDMISGKTLVKGWLLDENGVSKVNILIDGNVVGQASYGQPRADVQKVFPDYNNANSGFQYSLDTTKLDDGAHTLEIVEYGKDGSTYKLSSTIKVLNTQYDSYLQIDLRKNSDLTASDIVNFFNNSSHPDSPLKNYAQYFINAQNKYGVNALYLVAHSIVETGWGTQNSDLQLYKHNLFGYGAYNVCPFTCGYYFPNIEVGIDEVAYQIKTDYLNSDGQYYSTQYGPTLLGMQQNYATDPNWSSLIANIMSEIEPFNNYLYATETPDNPVLVAPGSYGRDIPNGDPVPSDIVINYATPKSATVNANYNMRSLPYVPGGTDDWTQIVTLTAGTNIKVLGYNTDVKTGGTYPYANLWYRVSVKTNSGVINGWIYGDGITISN